jgi:hypothetical protein
MQALKLAAVGALDPVPDEPELPGVVVSLFFEPQPARSRAAAAAVAITAVPFS